MIANYFEIGGGYSAGRDLLSADWRQRNVETGLLPPEVVSLFNNVEYFNGFFVEPVPLQVIDLIRDLKPHDNATVIQATIASEIGIQQMGISLNQRMGMLTETAWSYYGKDDDYFHVACLTLNMLFSSLNEFPDLLRIDIEGAEIGVLETYDFRPKPRVIIVDAHYKNSEACKTILKGHGYRCFGHSKQPEDVVGVLT